MVGLFFGRVWLFEPKPGQGEASIIGATTLYSILAGDLWLVIFWGLLKVPIVHIVVCLSCCFALTIGFVLGSLCFLALLFVFCICTSRKEAMRKYMVSQRGVGLSKGF